MEPSWHWLTSRNLFAQHSSLSYDEERSDGLVSEDIDGDRRILSMRIPDANGAWKICPPNHAY